MSDEVENTGEENQENQEPQYTEIELAAIEKGWKPKDQYNGDPDKWRSAEVFVALDEPLKRIEAQSKELRKVREALDALSTHHKRVKESEYERALKQLKAARKEAFRQGENEQALAYEERIEELQEEKERIVLPETNLEPEQTIHPEFQAWVDSNPWYVTDRVMRAAADAIGVELHAKGLSPQAVLKQVKEEMHKEFPHKFTNPKTQRPNAVESSSRTQARQPESVKMSEEDRKMMRKIVASGVMTEAEYLKEYQAVTKGA